MAFERIGIGGFLKFDERQALRGMSRARAGFARLKKGAARIGGGLTQIGGGIRNMALAMAPATLAIGFGIKKAAEFEKKMSGVAAITRASASDLAKLTEEAKRQGVVSVFSASESAEAMEFLGRAGFNTTQIITGLGGVMAAAAAEGIELSQSADIISRVVKGMGIEIDQASHVADILALTSAKTNTSILALGESFKFGAPQAKTMGISVEETAAAFGALADAGLRGSIGGTSFSNMLIKLSKPSSKAKKLLKKFNIQLTDSSGKLKPLPNLIAQFSSKIDKIPNVVEKARVATELFGIRGAKAYSALALKGSKALADLTADLKASSFGVGAAQEAADTRLDNFLGSLKLFASSIEAVTIEFFGPLLTQFKEATQDITGGLNEVLFVIQKLKAAEDTFSIAAGEASKKQASGIAKRLDLTKKLGDRQAALAQAGIAALVREGVGQEKLTRKQRKSRFLGLIQQAKVSTATSNFSKKRFSQERQALDALEERAKAGKLTAQDEAKIRNKFFQGLARQEAGSKKLSDAEAQRSGQRIAGMIGQQVVQAKIEAAANALLAKEEKLNEIEEKHGTTARLIAEGVLDAINEIKKGFDTVVTKIKAFGQRLEGAIGKDRLRGFVKMATLIGIIAGVAAPLVILFLGFAFVLKSIIGIVGGIASVVAGLATLFIPVVVIVGVLAGIFALIRKENESVGDTFKRVWGGIKQAFFFLLNDVIKPFIAGFREGFLETFGAVKEAWVETVSVFRQVFGELFAEISASLGDSQTNWLEVGKTVAHVVASIVIAVAKLAAFLVPILVTPFRTLFNSVREIVGGVIDIFQGKFRQGITRIFTGLLDIVTAPVRMLLQGLLQLAKVVPGVEALLGAKRFANLEKFAKFGLAGEPAQVKKTIEVITKGAAAGPRRRAPGRGSAPDLIGQLVKNQKRQERVRKILSEQGLETNRENVLAARNALQTAAKTKREEKQRQEKIADKELQANVSVTDQRETTVKTTLEVDGESLAKSSAKHKQTVFERNGATNDPFLRGVVAQTGTRMRGNAKAG